MKTIKMCGEWLSAQENATESPTVWNIVLSYKWTQNTRNIGIIRVTYNFYLSLTLIWRFTFTLKSVKVVLRWLNIWQHTTLANMNMETKVATKTNNYKTKTKLKVTSGSEVKRLEISLFHMVLRYWQTIISFCTIHASDRRTDRTATAVPRVALHAVEW